MADVARQAQENLLSFESANAGILDSLSGQKLEEYQRLVSRHRQTSYALERMQGFAQSEFDETGKLLRSASRDSLESIFTYYGFSKDDLEDVFFNIRRAYEASPDKASFGMKEFIDGYLKPSGLLSDGFDTKHFRFFQQIFEEYEKAFDGSMVIDKYVMEHQREQLQGTKKILNDLLDQHKAMIDSGDMAGAKRIIDESYGSGKTADDIISKIRDIDKAIELTLNPTEYQDVSTTRILLGEGLGKAVTDISDLNAEGGINARKYGFIGHGSDELFKIETKFGRFRANLLDPNAPDIISGQAITMDPMHALGGERVMSEVQANVFHAEFFQDQNMMAMMRQNMEQVDQEINEMFTSGVVSRKLFKRFQEQSAINVEDWDNLGFKTRSSAANFRSAAEEIVNFLLSGGKPDEIPRFANKIIRQAAKDVVRTQYKQSGTQLIYQPVLPFAQRQGVDTEMVVADRAFTNRVKNAEGLLLEDDVRLIGQNAYKDVQVQLDDNATRTMRLMRYRNDGHKFIVPDFAATGRAGALYTAGGGFDLDDKFIQNLSYVVDANGNKRLATFAFRQPTGAQEYALLAPQLDRASLERMMASEDFQGRQFRSALNDFGEEISKSVGFKATSKNVPTGEFVEQLRTATETGRMSSEERVIKYLEAVSKGNKRVADLYYTGGNADKRFWLTEDQIEQGFFHLDMREARQLSDDDLARLERLPQVFKQRYMDKQGGAGRGRISFSRLSNKLLDTAEITDGVYGGAKLQLSADQILDVDLNPSYRKSRLLSIHDAAITMNEDKVFNQRMQDLFNTQVGTGQTKLDLMKIQDFGDSSKYYSTFEDVVQGFKGLSTVPISEEQARTKAAFFLARQGIAESNADPADPLSRQILVQFAEMKNRLAAAASASADPGALGKYINTLAATYSTDKQLKDVLSQIRGMHFQTGDSSVGERIASYIYQPYLIHTPEGAIDFAIGGGGAVNFRQTAGDLVDMMKQFSMYDGISGQVDYKKSAANALFQLFDQEGYKNNTPFGELTFEEFQKILETPAHVQHESVMGSINVALERVRGNALVQQGEAIGKVRALYHSGLLSDDQADEMLRIAMDSFVGTSRLGSDDLRLVVEGMIAGARRTPEGLQEIAADLGVTLPDLASMQDIDGVGSYQGFIDYYQNLIDTKYSPKGDAFKNAVFDPKSPYSLALRHRGPAQEAYGLYSIQQLGRDQALKTEALISRVKKSRENTARMMMANPQVAQDAVAEQLTAEIFQTIGSETNSEKMLRFNEYDKIDRAIRQRLSSNKPIRDVGKFLSVEMGVDTEDPIGLYQMVTREEYISEVDRLRQLQELLAYERAQSLEEVGQEVYQILEQGITRTDRPADLNRVLQRLAIRIDDMNQSSDSSVTRVGNFLQGILENSDIYEREGRLRIDLAFEESRYAARTAGLGQRVQQSSERMDTLMAFIDQQTQNQNFESNVRYQEAKSAQDKIRFAFGTAEEIDLEAAGAESRRGALGSVVAAGDESMFENVLPQDMRLQIGKPRFQQMSMDELMDEAFAASGQQISDEERQILKDYIMVEKYQDQDLAESLIRSRMMEGTENFDSIALRTREAEVEAHLNHIRSLAFKRLAQNRQVNEIATDLLRQFSQDLDPGIPSVLDFIDELFPDVGDLTDEVMSDVPFKRFGDLIKEKIPQVKELISTASNNKGRVIAGAAMLAAGAFLYSKNRARDVSQGDIAGPPLLPGGSAYEMPQTQTVQYPDFSGTSINGLMGNSYQLQVSGSEEQMKNLVMQAREISPSTNATMYSTIRDPRQDPYKEIASSY